MGAKRAWTRMPNENVAAGTFALATGYREPPSTKEARRSRESRYIIDDVVVVVLWPGLLSH